MNEKKIKKMGNIENCPVRNVIDRIGDKWSMLIILLLAEEQVLRFNEIHKCIGTISQKMLTVTLKSLESDGLVKRTVFPKIPPKVEYELTQRGKSLLPHLLALTEWANNNMSDIKASREQYEKVNA